jgi:hypothetical protein
MAERMKDKEDLKLEAMFRSDPVLDDGFSRIVLKRVRRRMWVRRLSLPVAVILGLAISAKPLMQIVGVTAGFVESLLGMTLSVDQLPVGSLPPASSVMIGAALLMAAVLGSRILEE